MNEHGVSEVQIRRSGIEAGLDAEPPSVFERGRQLLLELFRLNDLDGPVRDQGQLSLNFAHWIFPPALMGPPPSRRGDGGVPFASLRSPAPCASLPRFESRHGSSGTPPFVGPIFPRCPAIPSTLPGAPG